MKHFRLAETFKSHCNIGGYLPNGNATIVSRSRAYRVKEFNLSGHYFRFFDLRNVKLKVI